MPDDSTAQVTITWQHTRTYRSTFPVNLLVEVIGRSADELVAHPSQLHGAVGARTARLLSDQQNTRTSLDGHDEVEITAAEIADGQPSLADLIDRGDRAVQAEQTSGRRTDIGRALAALLAGLRREEVIADEH